MQDDQKKEEEVLEERQEEEVQPKEEPKTPETPKETPTEPLLINGRPYKNLEEFEAKFNDMERGLNKYAEENARIKKALLGDDDPSNAGDTPEEIALDQLLIKRGFVKKEEAQQEAFNIVAGNQLQNQYLGFIQSNLKEPEEKLRLNVEEQNKLSDLVFNRGLSVEESFEFIKRKELEQIAVDEAKGFKPKSVNSDVGDLSNPVDLLGAEDTEYTIENMGKFIDKIF